MIIVSTPLRLLLYPILELSPVREGYKPLAVPVTPLATYAENVSGGSNSIWNTLCSHHSGRLSTMTYSQDGGCALVVLPPTGQSESDAVVHCPVNFPIARCATRSIWRRGDGAESTKLNSCVHFTNPGNQYGYMRLGRSRPPDPSHVSCISLNDTDGVIEDISWDEESGRICLVRFDGPDNRCLSIIDLL